MRWKIDGATRGVSVKLTRTERWMLSNQYKILAALYPDDADYFEKAREAIDCGYELHYDWITDYIYDDRDIMTPEESHEVIDILAAFSAIKWSYEALADKSGIDENHIKFRGFSGNDETKQMAYARYFCSTDGGRFTDLDRGDDFNSHFPMLDVYRRVLREWNKSVDKNNLSKEDLIRITSAWAAPRS